jgi:hypothetical protein
MATPGVLAGAGLLAVADRRSATAGHDREVLAAAYRSGDLVRVRRGTYIGATVWAGMSADERYATVVRVAVDGLADGVVSHWSAAALWGLPLVGRRDERVHVTVGPASGGRSDGDVVRHATNTDVPSVEHDGLALTTVARTVVDVARTAGFVAGTCMADHGLRAGVLTTRHLGDEAAAVGPRRGALVARAVAAFATAASQSVGESLSRARMHELGIPAPLLQHEIRDGRGLVGRVDFWWPGARLVGEFDGREKYHLGSATDPRAAADRLWQEKQREDRIRATGCRVVRWTWADAWAGGPMAAMLRSAGVR